MDKVYDTPHIKFKSLNYQIATEILKIASYLKLPDKMCKLCGQANEDINPIFFVCSTLKPVRNEFISPTVGGGYIFSLLSASAASAAAAATLLLANSSIMVGAINAKFKSSYVYPWVICCK